MRKKNGPKTGPGGTPALTFFHFVDWSLSSWSLTLWYPLCKKDSIRLNRLPLFLSLCIRNLCQTLLQTLDKSREIPETSKKGLAPKAVKILCVMGRSWCRLM